MLPFIYKTKQGMGFREGVDKEEIHVWLIV